MTQTQEKDFPTSVIDHYQDILDKFVSDPDAKPALDLVLVFSARTCYKAAALEEEPYLKFCLERLADEKKVFTFGCSFKLDKHILDTIFKKDSSDKEIYLGWYDEKGKKDIETYLDKIGKEHQATVCLVDLSKNNQTYIHRYVWGVEK